MSFLDGKELMLIIFATILTMTTPTGMTPSCIDISSTNITSVYRFIVPRFLFDISWYLPYHFRYWCGWWLSNVCIHHLRSCQHPQTRCSPLLYLLKSRLGELGGLVSNHNCTGLLQACHERLRADKQSRWRSVNVSNSPPNQIWHWISMANCCWTLPHSSFRNSLSTFDSPGIYPFRGFQAASRHREYRGSEECPKECWWYIHSFSDLSKCSRSYRQKESSHYRCVTCILMPRMFVVFICMNNRIHSIL